MWHSAGYYRLDVTFIRGARGRGARGRGARGRGARGRGAGGRGGGRGAQAGGRVTPEAQNAGSRSSGQVMQCEPPRPRPSSKPSIVMTSIPAMRRAVLVLVLRS